MPGMDMSFLQRLMTLDPNQIQNLSNVAAMKAPPPQIGPNMPGVLAPGAFAGVMDPTVGQVPQGVQNPLAMLGGGGQAQAAAPQAAPNPGFNAQQAGILSQMTTPQNLHFPGAAFFQRPGAISMNPVGVPQGNNSHASLAQLLGR